MPYRLKENLLLQAVANETVILDPDSGSYFTLDDVGTRMIELLQETGSLDAVVEQMQIEYDTSPATIRADLTELLEKMAEQGLTTHHFQWHTTPPHGA